VTGLKNPRVVATPEQWEELRAAKLGVCRICSDGYLPELHHVLARSLGGDDVAENLVSLCRRCHMEVEAHNVQACRQLNLNLRDEELEYLSEKKYAGYAARRYGKNAA
jgi:5-methylcytosine-specific restriction endonuclease McrA